MVGDRVSMPRVLARRRASLELWRLLGRPVRPDVRATYGIPR